MSFISLFLACSLPGAVYMAMLKVQRTFQHFQIVELRDIHSERNNQVYSRARLAQGVCAFMFPTAMEERTEAECDLAAQALAQNLYHTYSE